MMMLWCDPCEVAWDVESSDRQCWLCGQEGRQGAAATICARRTVS